MLLAQAYNKYLLNRLFSSCKHLIIPNSFVTPQMPAFPLPTLKRQLIETSPLLVFHSQGHRPHQCLVPLHSQDH